MLLLVVWVTINIVGIATFYNNSLKSNSALPVFCTVTLNIYWPGIVSGISLNIAVFSRTNIEILLRICIAKQISTWRRVYLSVIYCSFIWFNYVRSAKTRNAFDCCYASFDSRMIAILVPVKDVYVTLILLWHFYFEPSIFWSSSTNH